MSTRLLLSPAVTLALAALLLLTACDQWALFVNSDGVLSVSIFSDGSPRDGFRVRVRQTDGSTRVLDVPASGPLTVGGAAGTTVELTLLAPEGCRVSAPNPRTVSPGSDQTVGVVFDVHCG
jgi:hypothetical protein